MFKQYPDGESPDGGALNASLKLKRSRKDKNDDPTGFKTGWGFLKSFLDKTNTQAV